MRFTIAVVMRGRFSTRLFCCPFTRLSAQALPSLPVVGAWSRGNPSKK
jgi:hypothetical protein